MVPGATGKGEQAQGKALSTGRGKGSWAPQLRKKQRKRGLQGRQRSKRKAREAWEGVVGKEGGCELLLRGPGG